MAASSSARAAAAEAKRDAAKAHRRIRALEAALAAAQRAHDDAAAAHAAHVDDEDGNAPSNGDADGDEEEKVEVEVNAAMAKVAPTVVTPGAARSGELGQTIVMTPAVRDSCLPLHCVRILLTI